MEADTKRRLMGMRFPARRGQAGTEMPEWIGFMRKVNEVRPGTFGAPNNEAWWTGVHMVERYPGVDVIFSNSSDPQVVENEGVRIAVRDESLLPAFYEAAVATGYMEAEPALSGANNGRTL